MVDLVDTRLAGGVSAHGTTGGLVLSGSQVSGPVRIDGNATGAVPIVVAGNTIMGRLSCTGNDPAPVNRGEPNQVTGPTLGQCAEL